MVRVVGVDVSKRRLDVCVLIPGEKPGVFQFKNDPAGISGLLSRARETARGEAFTFCMESTGGYEFDLACHLCEHGERVSVVNPAWIKSFAGAGGRRNKTDRVDARTIGEYAQKMDPRAWEMTDPALREIAQLNRHRFRLIEELQLVRNWLEHRSHLPRFEVRQLLSQQSFLDLQLTETEMEISRLVNSNPDLLRKLQVLMRIPAMGPVLGLTLVCEMGDVLNYDSAQQYAAQAGVSPSRKESGEHKGHTRISKAGNVWVRRAGWMPARTAMTYNRPIKELSERLKEKQLKSKQIRTAAMRKLIMQAYGVLKAHAQGKEPFYPESTNENTQAKAGKKKDQAFKFRPSPSRNKARRELKSGLEGKPTPKRRKNRTLTQEGAEKTEELPRAA